MRSMLTEGRRNEIQARARAAIDEATLRKDAWWGPPLTSFVILSAAVVYGTWAAFIGKDYFAEPYLSPLYSPCLAVTCEHTTYGLLGDWWRLSPAVFILIYPMGFRLTCYYYRKAYYRAFWLSPPACAVAEPHKRYTGETRLPLIVQNLHRYFWYITAPFLVFLSWDTVAAFNFPDGVGIGVGTVVLGVNTLLLALYWASCHSCRHLVGGHVDRFSQAPFRHRLWTLASRLNERHMQIAWASLVWVMFSDLYIRLVATGVVGDPRIIF